MVEVKIANFYYFLKIIFYAKMFLVENRGIVDFEDKIIFV